MKSIFSLCMLVFTFSCFMSNSLCSVTSEELKEYAIKNNDSELIKVLLKYGDSIDQPILNQAMQDKDYFTVFMLIEYGVSINSRMNGMPSSIDYNNYYRTVLESAIAEHEMSLVEYFLLKKADATSEMQYTDGQHSFIKTAVYDAIMLNRLDVIILFAQYGVNLNKICYKKWHHYSHAGEYLEQTPLQVAIANRKKEIANFLLSIGVEI